MSNKPTRNIQDRKYSRIAYLTIKDILVSLDLSKYKFSKKERLKLYSQNCNRIHFLAFVFKKFINKVINDVIERGIQFQFPKCAKGIGNICIYRYVGDEYSTGVKHNDYFQEFDPLSTNFSVYRLAFIGYTSGGGTLRRDIYTDTKRKKRLIELANSGKLKQGGIKDYGDYKEEMHKQYSTLDLELLDNFMLSALKAFSKVLLNELDVYSYDPNRDGIFQIGVYYNDQKKFFSYARKRLRKKIRFLKRALKYYWSDDFHIIKPISFYLVHKKEIERGEELNFGNTYLYPCYDEALVRVNKGDVIFKVKDEGHNYTYKSKIWVSGYKQSQYEVVDILKEWDLNKLAERLPRCQILHKLKVNLNMIKQNNILKYKEIAIKTRENQRLISIKKWEQEE